VNPGAARAILNEFDRVRTRYEAFATQLSTLVELLLRKDDFVVHTVTARVKSRSSLEKKLLRPDKHYQSLADVTDLVGVRVVTYLVDDVERVKSLIEHEFVIDPVNSSDKAAVLDSDRFGYLSLHQVVQLKDSRAILSEYSAYSGLKAEFQVRSILQHAWAEIEHDLVYKASVQVPIDVQRRFFRLAGLFELADQEFTELRDVLRKRSSPLPSELVLITVESLNDFVEEDAAVIDLDRYVARYLSAALVGNDTEPDLPAKWRLLGLDTIGGLRNALLQRIGRVRQFTRFWRAGERAMKTYRGISLFYLRYVLLIERHDRQLARQVLSAVGVHNEREALIDRLFSMELS
jgi:Uncharacterized protein conserved in bacteria